MNNWLLLLNLNSWLLLLLLLNVSDWLLLLLLLLLLLDLMDCLLWWLNLFGWLLLLTLLNQYLILLFSLYLINRILTWISFVFTFLKRWFKIVLVLILLLIETMIMLNFCLFYKYVITLNTILFTLHGSLWLVILIVGL